MAVRTAEEPQLDADWLWPLTVPLPRQSRGSTRDDEGDNVVNAGVAVAWRIG